MIPTAGSDAPEMEVQFFGSEQQPLIIIDNFLAHPENFVADASMLSFGRIGDHYPGIRATLHAGMVDRFIGSVASVFQSAFSLQWPPTDVESCYSLVTTPPDALAKIQRLPHFDSPDPGRIALLHYLSADPVSGTAFFRHRATGFESVDVARFDHYSSLLAADLRSHGTPEPGYIEGSTAIFEQIFHVPARFNRAILYRGNTLHCAHIPEGTCLSADPEQGRLTINTFLQGKPASA